MSVDRSRFTLQSEDANFPSSQLHSLLETRCKYLNLSLAYDQ